MRIMIAMGHPKDVHVWKNVIHNLEKNGHEVKIAARAKDITLYLLDVYGFDYEVIGTNYGTLVKKAYGLFEGNINAFKLAKKFKPDILVSGGPYFAYVSKLIGKPQIDFIDTEPAKLSTLLSFHLSDVICTPSCFKKRINPKKHVTFDGYFELAYLHPNYFKPDPSVLDDLGLSKDDKFIVIRFVSWGASHDMGQHGFTNKREVISKLEKHGKLFITSEQKLSKDIEKYRITIPPEKIHDLLYYATMYVGDGGTMASEAAVLGTPAVFVSTIVSGYLYDEAQYGLVHVFSDPVTGEEEGMKKAMELVKCNNLNDEAQKRKKELLRGKIDVTKFLTELIENYPESCHIKGNGKR